MVWHPQAFISGKIRANRESAQFTLEDYLIKLDEGKYNITELKINEVNQSYSTIASAVLLAVKVIAESDSVLKHAFTFLSYLSHEVSLHFVERYVLRVLQSAQTENVKLRIQECPLFLHLGNQPASISLHHVVHDIIKLYVTQNERQKHGNASSADRVRIAYQAATSSCPAILCSPSESILYQNRESSAGNDTSKVEGIKTRTI